MARLRSNLCLEMSTDGGETWIPISAEASIEAVDTKIERQPLGDVTATLTVQGRISSRLWLLVLALDAIKVWR